MTDKNGSASWESVAMSALQGFRAALRLARELNLELLTPDPPCDDVAHHETLLADLDAELHNLDALRQEAPE